MPRVLVFNSTGGALALCSYLNRVRPDQYHFRLLDMNLVRLAKDWLNSEVVICLSIQSIGDARLIEHFIARIRSLGVQSVGWPKLIVGGPLFNVINCRDFLEEFPEVSYIVQDHGEQALADILDAAPSERVVSGSSYGEPANDRLVPVFPWHKDRPIPICRGTNICKWGRCRFCHHSNPLEDCQLSLEQFAQRIVDYYHTFGWHHFYIYDNHLAPDDLICILEHMERARIQPTFDVFGMRLLKPALKLTPYLKRTGMVRTIGWGLEAYSQPILNLYRKGILVKYIEPILSAAHEGGVNSTVYILGGLPGMQAEDYWKTYEFCAKHTGPDGLIQEIIFNWFLLNPAIISRLIHKAIRIRPGTRFCMNRYFGNDDELSHVRTCFVDFQARNVESGRWMSREEMFLEQSDVLVRLFSLPETQYDHRGFFLDPSMWPDFWGSHFPIWTHHHEAPISRAEYNPIVQ